VERYYPAIAYKPYIVSHIFNHKRYNKRGIIMAEPRLQPITLSPEMKETLKDMGPDISTLEFELAKAKRAGLNITDMEVKLAELKKIRIGLLKEYA